MKSAWYSRGINRVEINRAITRVKGDNGSWGLQLEWPHKNPKMYAKDNTKCNIIFFRIEWCNNQESEFQLSYPCPPSNKDEKTLITLTTWLCMHPS